MAAEVRAHIQGESGKAQEEEPEEGGEVDETGIDPKDIELVMQQVRAALAHSVFSPSSDPLRWDFGM
jgi:NACalpha-BTF3-like transcription factor